MSDEKLNFTMINYLVCNYCRYIAIGSRMDSSGSWNYGCGNSIEKGKYVRITSFPSPDVKTINGIKGCNQFEPSGLPTHSTIVARLIESNPLAKNIPIGNNTTETSWDFANKMLLFPHIRCDGSLEVDSS